MVRSILHKKTSEELIPESIHSKLENSKVLLRSQEGSQVKKY
jgi:hypothetical protein